MYSTLCYSVGISNQSDRTSEWGTMAHWTNLEWSAVKQMDQWSTYSVVEHGRSGYSRYSVRSRAMEHYGVPRYYVRSISRLEHSGELPWKKMWSQRLMGPETSTRDRYVLTEYVNLIFYTTVIGSIGCRFIYMSGLHMCNVCMCNVCIYVCK
jgi:hypothetical protein